MLFLYIYIFLGEWKILPLFCMAHDNFSIQRILTVFDLSYKVEEINGSMSGLLYPCKSFSGVYYFQHVRHSAIPWVHQQIKFLL